MQPSSPRSLDQVLTSLDSTYAPQIDMVRRQQADLPGQQVAEEQGLAAKQTNAFDEITNGARRKGLGFSGIPIGEQAKYSATEYMPALARLKTAGRQQAMSLEDAINQIYEKRNTFGNQIYQNEQQMFESRRQFDTNMAFQKEQENNRLREAARASASQFNPSMFNPNATGPKSNSATAVQRSDKGFNYFDASGKAISAAQYAAAKGLNFRDVLSSAAQQGDKGSQTALSFVGNDFGYDPRKVNSQQLASLYNALVWGTGKQASYTPNGHPGISTAPINSAPVSINYPGKGVNQHPNISIR